MELLNIFQKKNIILKITRFFSEFFSDFPGSSIWRSLDSATYIFHTILFRVYMNKLENGCFLIQSPRYPTLRFMQKSYGNPIGSARPLIRFKTHLIRFKLSQQGDFNRTLKKTESLEPAG